MVVDVLEIPVIEPLFIDEFHVIVYEPVLSCDKPNVIDEVVYAILVGEFAFPGTVSQKCE